MAETIVATVLKTKGAIKVAEVVMGVKKQLE